MGVFTVVGLPVYTLARYDGMALAPDALRRAGIVSALGPEARDLGDAQIPPLVYDTMEGGVKNIDHLRTATDRVCEKIRSGGTPENALCLGGECSIVLGTLAGFSEVFRGRPGLLWMDAHGDFNTPETTPSGFLGGMCLAMAAGRGPALSEGIERRRPLIAEESVVHLGSRALDAEEERIMGASAMKVLTMADLRKRGVADIATEATMHLEDRADWLVCHLDVDVIDPLLVPAVNYPTPNGMTLEETVSVVRALERTGKLRVVEVTAYNPSFDPDGASGRTVVKLLEEMLRRARTSFSKTTVQKK